MKEFNQEAIEDICLYALTNYGVDVTELTLTKEQLSEYNKKCFFAARILLSDNQAANAALSASSHTAVHLKTK